MKNTTSAGKKNYPYQKKYDAKNTKHYGFKFNLQTDSDIIALLDSAPSKQTLMKEIIRFYIENHTEGEGK